MSTPPVADLKALDREGRGLRVVFERAGDSYLQTLSAVVNGDEAPLLVANPSPPFQEVVSSVQRDWAGFTAVRPSEWPALLLTGSGDQRYWSAGVVALSDAKLALLSFDFACRLGRNAALPQVVFDAAQGVDVVLSGDDGDEDPSITLTLSNGLQFNLWAANRSVSDDPEVENQPTCRLRLDQSQIIVDPVGAPYFATGSTVQWCFEIALKRDG